MFRKSSQERPPAERRYDADTLRRVANLATRLQHQKQDTFTAVEVEAIGAEMGLDPTLVRQALERVAGDRESPSRPPEHVEFWSLVGSLAGALGWGLFALLAHALLPGSRGLMWFLTVGAPVPVAMLLGFLAGREWVGGRAGMLLAAALVPTLAVWSHPGIAIPYLALALPIGRWLGREGARIRDRYFPLASESRTLSRQALLDLLFAIRKQLEGQKQRRAFLSVDVVGSSEMKRGAPDLVVEHAFGQFHAWVEQVVRAQGGEMQSAAGDGVMCLFPTDAGAVRAARRLQDDLPRFNAEQNRLPVPFRVRCGVSAGEVGIAEGTPLGQLQSPVLDRAAALQRRAEPGGIVVGAEVDAAAASELGDLQPLEGVDQEAAGAGDLQVRARQGG